MKLVTERTDHWRKLNCEDITIGLNLNIPLKDRQHLSVRGLRYLTLFSSYCMYINILYIHEIKEHFLLYQTISLII